MRSPFGHQGREVEEWLPEGKLQKPGTPSRGQRAVGTFAEVKVGTTGALGQLQDLVSRVLSFWGPLSTAPKPCLILSLEEEGPCSG